MSFEFVTVEIHAHVARSTVHGSELCAHNIDFMVVTGTTLIMNWLMF